MKKIILLVLVALNAHLSTIYSQELPMSTNEDDKYGYFNNKWKEAVEDKYLEIEPFKDGLARVKIGEKYGAINELGREIIPIKYYPFEEFENGIAAFHIGEWYIQEGVMGKWGVIDHQNKIIIPPIYNQLERIYDDMFVVENEDKWGILDKNNKEIIPFIYNYINIIDTNLFIAIKEDTLHIDGLNEDGSFYYSKIEKWGVIDINNQEIIPFIYDKLETADTNLFIALMEDKWGVIDGNSKIIIPFKYKSINNYSNDYLIVELEVEEETELGVEIKEEVELEVDESEWENYESEKKHSSLLGTYDKLGNVVIDIKYKSIRELNDGLIVAQLGEFWGCLNENGEQVTPFKYDNVSHFENRYGILYKDGWSSVIDRHGQEIFSTQEHIVKYEFPGLFEISSDNKYGYLDLKGNVIIPPRYNNILWVFYPFENRVFTSEMLIAFTDTKNGVGIINAQGVNLFEPIYDNIVVYDLIHFESCYTYSPTRGEKEEETTNKKTAQSNDLMLYIVGDRFLIRHRNTEKNTTEIFNEKGEMILSLDKYQQLIVNENLTHMTVENNRKWGTIDLTGKEIIPPKYDEPVYFHDGFATTELKGKYGVVNLSGKEVASPIYDTIIVFKDGHANVKLKGKFGVIDSTGKEIVLPKYDAPIYFKESFAVIKVKGKYGFVDISGKEVIPPLYSVAEDFENGYAAVQNNSGKMGLIDTTGKEIIPFMYDKIQALTTNIIMILLNEKIGFINPSNQEITPLIYDDVLNIKKEEVHLIKDGKVFYLDLHSGKISNLY